MPLCDACANYEAIYHVTLQVNIFGPRSERVKSIQFWLCSDCERSTQQILAKDELRRARLAFRFVDNPAFLSPTGRWRRKEAPANPA